MARRFQEYVFDEDRAERPVRFIEQTCYLSKGQWAGKPFKLREWQKELIRELFGWIHKDTGLRRYRKAYVSMGKKNGKSHLAGGIANYMLFGDGEAGAEVACAANSRDQASIIYRACQGMVKRSPILNPEAELVPSTKRILYPKTDSFLHAVSADAGTNLGQDLSCLIYDEINFAPNRELFDALTTSTGSRRQPLQVFISTAGYDTSGVGYELYKYAKQVLANPEFDPSFFAKIYELDPDDDWTNEDNWSKANPALFDFLNIETLRDEARKAKATTSAQPGFKMYHCNQWTQAARSWLDVRRWTEQADPSFNLATLKGTPCHLGIDLSAKTDLTAVVAIWPLEDGRYFLEPHFFLPDADLRERCLRDHVPYDGWAEDGHLTLIPGETIDHNFIRKWLHEFAERHEIASIGFDPWNAHQLVSDLSDDGFQLVPIRQGHQSLGDATKEFEALIVGRKMVHRGNPCLAWQIGNVVTRADSNGNIVPDKKKSRHRIDGVYGSIMALDRTLRGQTGAPKRKKARELRVHVLG